MLLRVCTEQVDLRSAAVFWIPGLVKSNDSCFEDVIHYTRTAVTTSVYAQRPLGLEKLSQADGAEFSRAYVRGLAQPYLLSLRFSTRLAGIAEVLQISCFPLLQPNEEYEITIKGTSILQI